MGAVRGARSAAGGGGLSGRKMGDLCAIVVEKVKNVLVR